MKIGIIGAMEEEVVTLKEALTDTKTETIAGAEFTSGKYAQHEVILVRCGIGKVAAAVTATLLMDHFQVEALINTGSAGGIGEGLKVGDIVISERLAYHDADVTAFGYAPGQMARMPLYYEADTTLISTAKKAAQETEETVYTGTIVSGDQFVNSKERIAEIKEIFPEALANEMEATAIAQVAYQFSTPFVVVRAMSDVADEEASMTFDEFIQIAGKKSAEMVLKLLQKIEE